MSETKSLPSADSPFPAETALQQPNPPELEATLAMLKPRLMSSFEVANLIQPSAQRTAGFGLDKAALVNFFHELARRIECGAIIPQQHEQMTVSQVNDFALQMVNFTFAERRNKE